MQPSRSLGLAWPDGSCDDQVDPGRSAKIAAFPLLTCRSLVCITRFLLAFLLAMRRTCGSSCLPQSTLAPVVQPSVSTRIGELSHARVTKCLSLSIRACRREEPSDHGPGTVLDGDPVWLHGQTRSCTCLTMRSRVYAVKGLVPPYLRILELSPTSARVLHAVRAQPQGPCTAQAPHAVRVQPWVPHAVRELGAQHSIHHGSTNRCLARPVLKLVAGAHDTISQPCSWTLVPGATPGT